MSATKNRRHEEILQPMGPNRPREVVIYTNGKEVRLSVQRDDAIWIFRLDPDQAERVGKALQDVAREAREAAC